MAIRQIHPASGPPDASFQAPPSKSATHRGLVAAALAGGRSLLIDPLDSDDTRATLAGLDRIGVRCGAGPDGWWVEGTPAEGPAGGGEVALGESGTSLRFLAALAALGRRPTRFHGRGRLPVRPMSELLQALESLGAVVRRPGAGVSLPLTVGRGPARLEGGAVRIPSGRTSQFASALLLIGSRLAGGLDLELTGAPVSRPYVDMTAAVLTRFGACVERTGPAGWKVREAGYGGIDLVVEGDWSSASYLLAAAVVTGGTVRVGGLDPDSRQPDAALAGILSGLGYPVAVHGDVITVRGDRPVAGFDLDVAGSPDLAPTLAILGLFSRERCRLRSAGILRHKESDRLELLADNLNRLGRPAEVREDDLVLPACRSGLQGGEVRTGADHRIAMAFAVAGLRLPGVSIRDPECVGKSNPRFWSQLERFETGA